MSVSGKRTGSDRIEIAVETTSGAKDAPMGGFRFGGDVIFRNTTPRAALQRGGKSHRIHLKAPLLL